VKIFFIEGKAGNYDLGGRWRAKEGYPAWDKRKFRGEIITFSPSGVFTEK